MARSASLEESPWLPGFGWWPPTDEFGVTVVLSTTHATVEPAARFHVMLRGYAGSSDPVWEHDVGVIRHGEERAVDLDSLQLPDPPARFGGIVEVHLVRLDRLPKKNVASVGAWLDAHGRDGGGYLIPTIPIRGQRKIVLRDDLQVIPGIVSSNEIETELVLVNPIAEATRARLVATSVSGIALEGEWFEIAPWSVWRSGLSDELVRVRQLLDNDGGVGSLCVYSSHKILPYFGFRRSGEPLVSMDHSAPIFA
ncbi:MAG: hypothetical protein H0T13_02285 [Actinobacteria bacterium]|nr:hypothetical protein [Actinomycetota bacterium]